jgi:hypothetical protein
MFPQNGFETSKSAPGGARKKLAESTQFLF